MQIIKLFNSEQKCRQFSSSFFPYYCAEGIVFAKLSILVSRDDSNIYAPRHEKIHVNKGKENKEKTLCTLVCSPLSLWTLLLSVSKVCLVLWACRLVSIIYESQPEISTTKIAKTLLWFWVWVCHVTLKVFFPSVVSYFTLAVFALPPPLPCLPCDNCYSTACHLLTSLICSCLLPFSCLAVLPGPSGLTLYPPAYPKNDFHCTMTLPPGGWEWLHVAAECHLFGCGPGWMWNQAEEITID